MRWLIEAWSSAVRLSEASSAAVKAAVSGELRGPKQGVLGSLLNLGPARSVLASRMRSEADKKAPREHYPAPYALIDLWVEHGGDAEAMQKAEISSFAKLLVTETAQNLVRVFFLRNKLKSLADGTWDGRRVHVRGRLLAGDRVTVEASGVFVVVPVERILAMLAPGSDRDRDR